MGCSRSKERLEDSVEGRLPLCMVDRHWVVVFSMDIYPAP
jgi:hypothetical protein